MQMCLNANMLSCMQSYVKQAYRNTYLYLHACMPTYLTCMHAKEMHNFRACKVYRTVKSDPGRQDSHKICSDETGVA
jgi:hypothetical protein